MMLKTTLNLTADRVMESSGEAEIKARMETHPNVIKEEVMI